MYLKALQEKIAANEVSDAIFLVEQIGSDKQNDVVPFLIEQLEKTDNHLLRNAIALALSDIGSQEAVEPIIRLLKDQKTNGYRGTLLAALEPLDYSEHLNILVDFICEGNFEVSRKAFILIKPYVKNLKCDIKNEYLRKLKKKLMRLEDSIEIVEESIDLFTED